jgi:hypothetical protein
VRGGGWGGGGLGGGVRTSNNEGISETSRSESSMLKRCGQARAGFAISFVFDEVFEKPTL